MFLQASLELTINQLAYLRLSMLCLQARKQPSTQAEVIEYLLSTETGEMQYETARCRPQLDASFFTYLDRQVGGCIPELHCASRLFPVVDLHVCSTVRTHWASVCADGVKSFKQQS